MSGLGDTIAQLVRNRRQTDADQRRGEAQSRLAEVAQFGTNPGDLRMLTYVPAGLPPGAPLVVVMHGCTQTAAGYDAGSGWSSLAERHGFAVLFPEQRRSNNPNLCFNWYQPEDTARQGGEAESIQQMVRHMLTAHAASPHRVFVTGLSAGGAMTAVMLATYPELFAAGGIIAGLPYRSANSVSEAFEAMRAQRMHSPQEWGDLVRAASPHRGPWPRVQIWHGGSDSTVRPGNAAELVKQWTNVHGLPEAPAMNDTLDGAAHRVWGAESVLVEAFMVPGLQHGTPLNLGSSDLDTAAGEAGPYMLDCRISATAYMVRSWGLMTVAPRTQQRRRPAAKPDFAIPGLGALPQFAMPNFAKAGFGKTGFAKTGFAKTGFDSPAGRRAVNPAVVISKALRAAGLLRRPH